MQIVRGHLQAYPWGPVDGLAAWTAATAGPQAELWFGSHPNGPSPLRAGEGTAQGRSPVLVKILAAARPLSIQIHPPARLAAQMYTGQQHGGPALVSDPYGKFEMLIAVEDFLILEGLRDPAASLAVFEALGPALAPVVGALRAADLPAAIRAALATPADVAERQGPSLPRACEQAGLDEDTQRAMQEVAATYPQDPGVFVAALLGARTLAAGQAVYVEPGTVHAYVRGLGVEVMTSSDNVLRLGLTGKTIAVEQALTALDVTGVPQFCGPRRWAGVDHYAPAGAPFTVDLLEDASMPAPAGRHRTVVCLRGRTRVADLVLAPGEAVLLDSDDPLMSISAEGTAVLATASSDGKG